MSNRSTDKETQAIIEQAALLAEKLKIKKILVVCESLSLWKALLPHYANHQFIIAISNKKLAESITVETFLADFNGITRRDRLNYILRSAVEAEKVRKGERILCLCSLSGQKPLDTMRVVRIQEYYGPISPHDLKRIGRNIPVDLLFLIANLAIEIGQEGREGLPVGTIFVVGDTEKVLELSKPMIFNPFKGYGPEETNIFDVKVQESVKELTLIDGAFIIREDGVVLSAGRFLHAGAGKSSPMRGLGARHAAASAISHHTKCVAITVSESTGTVRIFSSGKSVRTIRSFRPPTQIHKKN
jgi:DNA integrity scanning protein DisA with diadenylate cyclase activity